MSSDYLAIYLNDHLMGSTTGVELAKRIQGSAKGEPLGDVMDRLVREIEEDRDTLKGVMRAVDAGEDHLKVVAGFTAEKIGRFKLNGHLLSPSPLSRLIELEGLSLGIEGKRSLWAALRSIDDPRLAEFDLLDLENKAIRQREELEPFRLEAAHASLGVAATA